MRLKKARKAKTQQERVPYIDFSGGVRGKYAERYGIDELSNLPLTAKQAEELDRRLAAHELNPDEGVVWEELRDRLRKRRIRAAERRNLVSPARKRRE